MLNYWVGRGLRRLDEWVIFGRVRNVLSSYMISKHGLPFPNQLYYKSFSINQIVCPYIRFFSLLVPPGEFRQVEGSYWFVC